MYPKGLEKGDGGRLSYEALQASPGQTSCSKSASGLLECMVTWVC